MKEQNPGGRGGHLVDYFHDVDLFSKEHLRDIARFKRLLESMAKARQGKADRRTVAELSSILEKFQAYLKNHSRVLSEHERRELAAITGSRLPPTAKKRIAEDLIHKIKQRDEREEQARTEQHLAEEEIRQLGHGRGGIAGWFRLTKFSLIYGTITLLTHQIKAGALDHIRSEAYEWQLLLGKSISPILDRDYYLLTTLEYNSLAAILELSSPINGIRELPARSSFAPSDISSQMDAFAAAYITLLKNAELAESTFQKVFKSRKTAHGLYGALKSLLNQPIFKNQPLMRSAAEKIRDSIYGAIISFYSVREGVIFQTVSQILHILQIDGALDESGKHLTPDAARIEQENRRRKLTEEQRLRDKYSELERILEAFLSCGQSMESRIYRAEAGLLYQAWESEHGSRPMLRIKRLSEGFIRHFSEYIGGEKNITIEYDKKLYPQYFSIRPEIIDAAAFFNIMEFEMTGLKAIDIAKITTPPGMNPPEYIRNLTRPEAPPTQFSPVENFARSILTRLGSRSFHLAIKLNDLIAEYYNQKALIQPTIELSYDFFINATVSSTRSMKTGFILNRSPLTLQDFLDNACALAFYIAQECNHPGIKALRDEKEALKLEIENIATAEGAMENGTEDLAALGQRCVIAPENLSLEADSLYRDAITGLNRREYLDDILIPEYYDSELNYSLDESRFVICLAIDNFRSFNEVFGLDTGDRILAETARRITEHIRAPGTDSRNTAIRYRGSELLAYIYSVSLLETVEMMDRLRQDVSRIDIVSGKGSVGQIAVSIGIYEERKGTNVYDNILIAGKIAAFAGAGNGNTIGFARNPYQIITQRDFGQAGELNAGMLTTLHGRQDHGV